MSTKLDILEKKIDYLIFKENYREKTYFLKKVLTLLLKTILQIGTVLLFVGVFYGDKDAAYLRVFYLISMVLAAILTLYLTN